MASILKGQPAGPGAAVSMEVLAAGIEAVRALYEAHRAEKARPGGRIAGAARRFLGRGLSPLHVFAGSAVPSLQSAGRHLALADVAALDAVEGRARFERPQQARFGK